MIGSKHESVAENCGESQRYVERNGDNQESCASRYGTTIFTSKADRFRGNRRIIWSSFHALSGVTSYVMFSSITTCVLTVCDKGCAGNVSQIMSSFLTTVACPWIINRTFNPVGLYFAVHQEGILLAVLLFRTKRVQGVNVPQTQTQTQTSSTTQWSLSVI